MLSPAISLSRGVHLGQRRPGGRQQVGPPGRQRGRLASRGDAAQLPDRAPTKVPHCAIVKTSPSSRRTTIARRSSAYLSTFLPGTGLNVANVEGQAEQRSSCSLYVARQEKNARTKRFLHSRPIFCAVSVTLEKWKSTEPRNAQTWQSKGETT
jgi:hypothetical protein